MFSLRTNLPQGLFKACIVPRPIAWNALVHLECKLYQTEQLSTNSPKNINRMVIGTVVGININPEVLTDGRVDIKKNGPY